LKNAKNGCFTSSSTAAFASDSFGTKVRFINLDFAFKGRFRFAFLFLRVMTISYSIN
jgi:hypothetical protein